MSNEQPDSQDGREAVITHEEAIEAYALIDDGVFPDGIPLIRGMLSRPSKNDEEKTDERI